MVQGKVVKGKDPVLDRDSLVRKYQYLVTFELPNEFTQLPYYAPVERYNPKTGEFENTEEVRYHTTTKKSWQVIHTNRPITNGDELVQILNNIVIQYEITPPIVPLNVSYLGEEVVDTSGAVLLYQMGRVASVALRTALEKFQGMEVRHMHYLMHEGEYGSQYDPTWVKRIQTENRVWKVITIVRNPIARCVSGYFWGEGGKEPYSDGTVQDFLANYNHNWTVDWMDTELNEALNINIYERDFNKEVGYSIYSRTTGDTRPYFDLLVLRTEEITKVARTAIMEFLNVDIGGELKETNVTEKRKQVSEAYKEFKARAVLPDDYLDWILNTKYAKHFYASEELEATRLWWSTAPEERGEVLKTWARRVTELKHGNVS